VLAKNETDFPQVGAFHPAVVTTCPALLVEVGFQMRTPSRKYVAGGTAHTGPIHVLGSGFQ